MLNSRHHAGDIVVLKDGLFKGTQPKGSGRVVSVLPETRGLVQYRVRFQNENFERNVSEDELDAASSTSSEDNSRAEPTRDPSSSWINSNKIRIRK